MAVEAVGGRVDVGQDVARAIAFVMRMLWLNPTRPVRLMSTSSISSIVVIARAEAW